MVTLPTRDELRVTLEQSTKAESLAAAAKTAAAAAAAATALSSALLDASSNGGSSNNSPSPSLNTRLRTVRTLVKQQSMKKDKL